MPFEEDFYLPEESELTVQEVNISTPSLKAGAYHYGSYCDRKNREFMLCRAEEKDPRKCLNEGRVVTACALEFFQKVKENCRDSFEKYAHCLEWNSADMNFEPCKKTQARFDMCMLEKLELPRPELGYLSRTYAHETNRPKPPPKNLREYNDPTPGLPDDYPKQEPKYGSRLFFT
ncbi:NADH dehydrogenase [ubiquinone] 1 alpha subcomplex subunit 8 [Centruroides vittatus]|uniref:NADH dehydrogenase [ubiquinone] 1 alpha subcomplex subunit 8 n=1 Tax=Centruroides vittatus TaxID=120091 RepID=UPI00350FD942